MESSCGLSRCWNALRPAALLAIGLFFASICRSAAASGNEKLTFAVPNATVYVGQRVPIEVRANDQVTEAEVARGFTAGLTFFVEAATKSAVPVFENGRWFIEGRKPSQGTVKLLAKRNASVMTANDYDAFLNAHQIVRVNGDEIAAGEFRVIGPDKLNILQGGAPAPSRLSARAGAILKGFTVRAQNDTGEELALEEVTWKVSDEKDLLIAAAPGQGAVATFGPEVKGVKPGQEIWVKPLRKASAKLIVQYVDVRGESEFDIGAASVQFTATSQRTKVLEVRDEANLTAEVGADAVAGRLEYSSSAPDILAVDATGKVTGREIGTARVTARYVVEGQTAGEAHQDIQVVAEAGEIVIRNKQTTLLPDETREMQIDVLDRAGRLITDNSDRVLKVEVTDPTVVLAEIVGGGGSNTARTLRVKALRARQDGAGVAVTVKLLKGDRVTDTDEVVIAIATVEAFKSLKVDLSVLSNKFVSDTFGSQASRDFHILQVTLTNNLVDDNGRPLGQSILAFSSSVQARVVLEKMPSDPPSGRGEGGGEWTRVTRRDVEADFGPVPAPLLDLTALQTEGALYPGIDLAVGEERQLSVSARTSSGAAQRLTILQWESSDPTVVSVRADGVVRALRKSSDPVRLTAVSDTNKKFFVTVVVKPASEAPGFPFLYRPYTAEITASGYDVRVSQQWRSRFLRFLSQAGSLASFANALDLTPSARAANALDKFSNLLIPGLDKTMPDHREVQRQNLIRFLMQPVEEIPAGSSITKYLVFPKSEITGYLSGFKTRIGAISTDSFSIEVALVQKARVSAQTNSVTVPAP